MTQLTQDKFVRSVRYCFAILFFDCFRQKKRSGKVTPVNVIIKLENQKRLIEQLPFFENDVFAVLLVPFI